MDRIIRMSQKELNRVPIMEKVLNNQLTLKDAAILMNIGKRQAIRIKANFAKLGPVGLVHKSRGRKSNNAYSSKFKERVIKIFKREFRDFNYVHASEMLKEEFDISVNAETLRLWVKNAGLGIRKRYYRKHRLSRERKQHFGEMIQMDGSFHRWFKEDETKYCLMNMVDDATNTTLSYLGTEETTELAFRGLEAWIQRYGIPQSLYVDRRNVFKTGLDRTESNFERACNKLGIKIITANSPQAKGRVERSNAIHQDRLINELEYNDIKSIKKANKYLAKKYISKLNKKFQVKAGKNIDFHRQKPSGLNLNEILSIEKERTVNNDWTISYEGVYYQIKRSNSVLPAPRDKVIVRVCLDKEFQLIYKNLKLEYKKLKKKAEKKR